VDREQDACPEVVLQPSPDAPPEPGVLGGAGIEPQRPAQLVPSGRGPAELELPDHVAVEAALPEVPAGRPRVRRGQQTLVVPRHRLRHRLDEPRPALAALALVPVGVAQRHADPGGEVLYGLGEAELLYLTDERDDVAVRLA